MPLPSPSAAPSPRRPLPRGVPDLSWTPRVAVALLSAFLLISGALPWLGSRALGTKVSEAPGHLWGLWATASRIFTYGPLVRVVDLSWPRGFAQHLMDPINLAVFLPLYWLGGGGATGAALGWNGLHLAASLLASWGCWRLGRRLLGPGAQPWALAALGAAFAASPYLLGTPQLGRSEMLPAVLWPLHLAWLHAWLRCPAGDEQGTGAAPRWGVGVKAGLSLGAIALGGWYLAVFLAILEPPVALWLGRRCPPRELGWRLGLVAGIGVLCALPALWATVHFPPPYAMNMPGSSAVTPMAFSSSALPLALRLGQAQGSGLELPPYTGVVALGLAIYAAIRAPRRALFWLLLGLGALVLAFGPFARLSSGPRAPGQQVSALTMPVAWMMAAIPRLAMLRHWSRLCLLGALPLGVGAMIGVQSLPLRGWRGMAIGAALCGAMVLDAATFPVRWATGGPSFAVAPPAELSAALDSLPAGAVVELPMDGMSIDPHGSFGQGMYQLWQQSHGRPLSAGGLGEDDGATRWNALVGVARAVQLQDRGGSMGPSASAELLRACVQSGVSGLLTNGYAGVVLHTDRDHGPALRTLLTSALGAPSWSGETTLAWTLQAGSARSASGASCEAFIDHRRGP